MSTKMGSLPTKENGGNKTTITIYPSRLGFKRCISLPFGKLVDYDKVQEEKEIKVIRKMRKLNMRLVSYDRKRSSVRRGMDTVMIFESRSNKCQA